MQKVLTLVSETAPLEEGDVLCKKGGWPWVSASWPTSHFLKALKIQGPHCFSSSSIRTPSHEICHPLAWIHNYFWITTYRWSYRVCDLPKVTTNIGIHRPASSFGHFTTSLTHSSSVKCQPQAMYGAACQGCNVEWGMIPSLQRHTVINTRVNDCISVLSAPW